MYIYIYIYRVKPTYRCMYVSMYVYSCVLGNLDTSQIAMDTSCVYAIHKQTRYHGGQFTTIRDTPPHKVFFLRKVIHLRWFSSAVSRASLKACKPKRVAQAYACAIRS